MISAGQIRWLAGLLEGEGYFTTRKTGIYVGVAMTDRDVMETATNLLAPGKRLYEYETWVKGKQHKTRFQTTIGGGPAAGWMMTVYSLMHSRRRGQIRRALAKWRTQGRAPKDRTHCPRGHAYDAVHRKEGAFRNRRCLTCDAAQLRAGRRRDRQTLPLWGAKR